jgi:4-amino-4-deoxy-L-arabinose transferase-like glycosyltransferase
MSLASRSRQLFSLLLAAVLIRLPWMFVIPTSDAPDEINHLWVIDFLRTHLRLPSQAEVFASGRIGVYGSLPQFGYLPHVMTSMLLPSSLFAARCGSLLAALAAITAAYFIGREIFTGRRLLALALPCLLVVQPQFIFVSCYCNNDSTLAALAGWIMYLLIRCIKYGLTARRGLLLAVLLSWLTLCKYSGLSLLPVVLAAILFAVWASPAAARPSVLTFLILLIVPYALLTVWWPIRNYCEFGGDVLGTQTMYYTWAKTFHRQLNYYMPAWQILLTPRWWRMLFYSFWGAYGHMNKYLWRPVYFVYLGFVIAAIWGWLYSAVRKRISIQQMIAGQSAIWLLFAFAFLANMAALVWAGTGNLGGPQGRYLFTSLIPIDALLIAGLNLIGRRHGNAVVLSFLGFNFVVDCGSWIYLYLLYGFQCG